MGEGRRKREMGREEGRHREREREYITVHLRQKDKQLRPRMGHRIPPRNERKSGPTLTGSHCGRGSLALRPLKGHFSSLCFTSSKEKLH